MVQVSVVIACMTSLRISIVDHTEHLHLGPRASFTRLVGVATRQLPSPLVWCARSLTTQLDLPLAVDPCSHMVPNGQEQNDKPMFVFLASVRRQSRLGNNGQTTCEKDMFVILEVRSARPPLSEKWGCHTLRSSITLGMSLTLIKHRSSGERLH